MNSECLKIRFDCNLNITSIPCENNRTEAADDIDVTFKMD